MFYLSHLSRHVELREVLKLEMILSHSNARVKSGYSANEEIIVENMSQGSLVTRRMVFDGVMNKGNISNVDVNRKMLKFVNNAHSEYVKQLEKKKEQQTSGGKKRAEKRKITNELKKGKEAKQKIEEQHLQKSAEVVSQIFNLEEQLRKNVTPCYRLKFILSCFFPICLFLIFQET